MIDIQHILDTELKMGVKLPECYKQSMQAKNGGDIELVVNDEALFQMYCDEDYNKMDFSLLPFFNPLNRKTISKTCNSIDKSQNNLFDFVVFAYNDSGDALAFKLDKDKAGDEVYFIPHDNDQIIQVANSFSELVRV